MPGATEPVDGPDDDQPPDAEGRPDLEWEQVPDLEDVHQDADDDLGEGAD